MATGPDGHSIRRFTEEAEAIVPSAPSESELLRGLKPRMQRLLRTPGSVPTEAANS